MDDRVDQQGLSSVTPGACLAARYPPAGAKVSQLSYGLTTSLTVICIGEFLIPGAVMVTMSM